MAKLSFTLSPIIYNSLSGASFQTEQQQKNRTHAAKDKGMQNGRSQKIRSLQECHPD